MIHAIANIPGNLKTGGTVDKAILVIFDIGSDLRIVGH